VHALTQYTVYGAGKVKRFSKKLKVAARRYAGTISIDRLKTRLDKPDRLLILPYFPAAWLENYLSGLWVSESYLYFLFYNLLCYNFGE
jgi:hypothetical protein